jgi:hypothetical protein
MRRIPVLLAAAVLAVAACDNTDESGVPTEMTIVSGNGQDGPINTRAEDPLRVRLTTIVGEPTPGIRVQWTVMSGSAIPDSSRSITDENGVAETGVQYGAQGGPIIIRASVPGVVIDPVEFELDAIAENGGGGGGGGGAAPPARP